MILIDAVCWCGNIQKQYSKLLFVTMLNILIRNIKVKTV